MSGVVCSRCGREDELRYGSDGVLPEQWFLLPDGWEGSINREGESSNAVCPGCQFAVWHPHCTSLRSDYGYGGRVDVEALKRGEQITYRDQDGDLLTARSLDEVRGELGRCEYIDLSIEILDLEADWPSSWTCPQCGGTSFEAVHADYQQSGLKGGDFGVEIEEE